MNLCFATNNPGKLKEINTLVGDQYNILSLADIGCKEELPETQDTIEGNSLQKAEFVWKKYNVNCFADDTGLEVLALDGAPGVISARYAGEACNPEDNMAKLLREMQGLKDRRARFRTCITLIMDGSVHQFEGVVRGDILKEKIGDQGFGYDPIFKPEGHELSFAQLPLDEKNKISHRGRAVKALIDFLNMNE
ncbi:MAG TPA: non-canonical purine NTP diphosphatase [Cytophagaceae bacterium]|jgi:XTP/dITP diphosphohydrolase|nr:non-canonical purine NTP diphosphatase [Cytophagaceae bacterium]